MSDDTSIADASCEVPELRSTGAEEWEREAHEAEKIVLESLVVDELAKATQLVDLPSHSSPKAADSVPQEAVFLYHRIPKGLQDLINDAGKEALMRGDQYVLKLDDLRLLGDLTVDEAHRAGQLVQKGVPAEITIRTILTDVAHRRPLKKNSQENLSLVLPFYPPSRKAKQLSARRSDGWEADYRGSSMVLKSPTRVYNRAQEEHRAFKDAARDQALCSPEAMRLNLPLHLANQRGLSPHKGHRLRRGENPYAPQSMAGKVTQEPNRGSGMRSRSPRMAPPREPVTHQMYTIPGLADEVRNRSKRTPGGSFSRSPQAVSYLPRNVQSVYVKEQKSEHVASLTAAANYDAEDILQSAAGRTRSPSPSVAPLCRRRGVSPSPGVHSRDRSPSPRPSSRVTSEASPSPVIPRNHVDPTLFRKVADMQQAEQMKKIMEQQQQQVAKSLAQGALHKGVLLSAISSGMAGVGLEARLRRYQLPLKTGSKLSKAAGTAT